MEGPAARLFVLLDVLQGRGRTTTRALAEELGVGERTVRRDLTRLQDLDVPVEVRPGRHGGVWLPPGALLPPLRFTDDELLALVLGVKQVQRLGDAGLDRAASRALRRLEAVLSEATRERVEALARALVDEAEPARTGVPLDSGRVVALAEAVHRRRRLELEYVSPRSGATRRTVDPYGLARLGAWYLAAYCHRRQDVRTFRIDRIRTFRVLEIPFEPPADFDAYASIAASLAAAPTPGDVVCRARLDTGLEEASRLVPATVVMLEPRDDGVLLTVRARPERLDAIAMHLLGLPCRVEVLGPPALSEACARLATRAADLAGR